MKASRLPLGMSHETPSTDKAATLISDSLNEKLAVIRRERLKGEAADAFEEVMQRFDSGSMLENALKIGDRMPEFHLPNSDGRLVHSAALLARGPLIVTFYRGSWCPYCMVTLEALESLRPAFASRGASLVALSPETGGRGSEVKRLHNLQFEVLTDVDNAVAVQFGVMIRLPERYRRLMASKGVDAQPWHGNSSWFIPLPSTFVMAVDGTVVHTEIHVDFTSRTEPVTLERVLKKLDNGAPQEI
jgi:peroxiredoxin